MFQLRSRRLTFIALASAVLGIPVFAQTPSGRITGVVRDAQGSPRAAARVVATNNATRSARSATTTADGAYAIVGLAPGAYTVTASQIGFRRATQSDVQVQ